MLDAPGAASPTVSRPAPWQTPLESGLTSSTFRCLRFDKSSSSRTEHWRSFALWRASRTRFSTERSPVTWAGQTGSVCS